MSETYQPGASAPVAANPVIQSVVNSVYSSPSVQPKNAAGVAAEVLQGLLPLLQPAETLAGASTRTDAIVALGVAGFEAILSVFFPHPALTQPAQ